MNNTEVIEQIKLDIIKEIQPEIKTTLIQQSSSFSGPIPPPEMCREYEQVLSGFTERSLTIAETVQKESIRKSKSDEKFRETDSRRQHSYSMVALICAFLLVSLLIIGALFLIFKGFSIAGYVTFAGTVATIIYAIKSR